MNRARIVHRRAFIPIRNHFNGVAFFETLHRDALLLALHIGLAIEAEAINLVGTLGAKTEFPHRPWIVAFDQHAANHTGERGLLRSQSAARGEAQHRRQEW